jgi:5-methylcytosine-specific restriction endonuclease McrA
MPRGRKVGSSKRIPGVDATCSTCARLLPSLAFRTRTVAGYMYLRSQCKECEKPAINAAIKRWHARNRDQWNAYKRGWASKNRDKTSATYARWFKTHPEYFTTEKYRSNHRNSQERRRARLEGAESTLTQQQWREIVEYFGGRCAYCLAPCSEPTQDHVTPIARGGSHTMDNIVPACSPCNTKKGDKLLARWLSVGIAGGY